MMGELFNADGQRATRDHFHGAGSNWIFRNLASGAGRYLRIGAAAGIAWQRGENDARRHAELCKQEAPASHWRRLFATRVRSVIA